MSTAKITETARYLTFRLGGELFAINVFKAREVLDLSHITRVPTAPGYLPTAEFELPAGKSRPVAKPDTFMIMVVRP